MILNNTLLTGHLLVKSPGRQLILLLVSLLIHGIVQAQQTYRQTQPLRKPTIINKANQPSQNNTNFNSQSSISNRISCDFTLTPVHAINNPLSQIIQSLAGSGVTISNIQ